VPSSHWASSYVERAVTANIVNGYGDGTYGIDDSVKAAEWCKMFVSAALMSEYKASNENAYFWWAVWVRTAQDAGTLEGTEFVKLYSTKVTDNEYAWYKDVATHDITRFDMAQTIYKLVSGKLGKSVDTSSASSSITDWAAIPSQYQAAVAYCYASGLLTGMDGGYFNGTQSMTRGQAATVVSRLLDVVEGKWEFGASVSNGTVESPVSNNTGSSVADRLTISAGTGGFDYNVAITSNAVAGKLANDAAVTEANIKAILAEIEAIFPDGASWGSEQNGGTRYLFTNTLNPVGRAGGCGSFAGMVSDLIWGVGASYTTHSDITKAKVGDIVYCKNNSTGYEHWIVVSGFGDFYEDIGLALDSSVNSAYFAKCDGNSSAKVSWGEKYGVSAFCSDYPNYTIYTAY